MAEPTGQSNVVIKTRDYMWVQNNVTFKILMDLKKKRLKLSYNYILSIFFVRVSSNKKEWEKNYLYRS